MGQYFTNQNLNSNIVKHEVKICDTKLSFNTDNGVFSKTKIDFGTRFLLETITPLELSGSILDVGCGYGVIGIYLSKVFGTTVDMVDVNKRALHLSKMNAKENNVKCNIFESNAYENVNGRYNYIVTNPPIRAGKQVVYDILMNASTYLLENGKLYLVIRKNHGAKSIIFDLEKIYDVNILAKHNGFFVIEAKKR